MTQLLRNLLPCAYRVAQRCFVLDITKLLVKDCNDEIDVVPVGELECRFLSYESLVAHANDTELNLTEEMVSRAQSGLDDCVVAMDQGQIVAYFWVAHGGIEAEHNRGAHPLSGVAISYESNTAFIYNAFARSSYRGRRIFPALLCYAARTLQLEKGISQLISTTDWTNVAALASFRRAGFSSVGHVFRWVFGRPYTWHPALEQVAFAEAADVPERRKTRVKPPTSSVLTHALGN